MTERMPFGKHRGERLSDIPVGYLDWLIGEDWMDEPGKRALKADILAHLKTRADWAQLDDDGKADEGEMHGPDEWRNW
jgi:uncharacterized protein (DUF3820 family)